MEGGQEDAAVGDAAPPSICSRLFTRRENIQVEMARPARHGRHGRRKSRGRAAGGAGPPRRLPSRPLLPLLHLSGAAPAPPFTCFPPGKGVGPSAARRSGGAEAAAKAGQGARHTAARSGLDHRRTAEGRARGLRGGSPRRGVSGLPTSSCVAPTHARQRDDAQAATLKVQTLRTFALATRYNI